MTSLTAVQPIFRSKRHALDIQDLEGLLKIHWKINHLTLYSGLFTRIDQVFLLWGIITATIFLTEQFLPISWITQAVLWSVLTMVGTLGTVHLSWYWVSVEQLRWVVYCWVGLMLAGVAATDFAIFGGGWQLLMHLYPLWLGLSALGYLLTAWGLRSYAFLISCLLHLLAIASLSFLPQWQALITGITTAGCLFLLAEVEWDMQSTSDFQILTEEQKQFNAQQRRLRESNAYHC
jgi:hypothetical protein